jgi:AcrR family transcriptional regulator
MAAVTAELGLRERKKQRTRQLIAGVAWGLFIERGYDQVSVAEIAREADVSEATVFNYFPAKEDLVFGALTDFEEGMLASVKARPADESVVSAFARMLREPGGLLGTDDPEATSRIAQATRLIVGSRSLLARERELYDHYTESLTSLIAKERGVTKDDVEPRVLAYALIGVQRSLLAEVRRQVLAGRDRRSIARQTHASAQRAIGLLERGLAEHR